MCVFFFVCCGLLNDILLLLCVQYVLQYSYIITYVNHINFIGAFTVDEAGYLNPVHSRSITARSVPRLFQNVPRSMDTLELGSAFSLPRR